MIRILFKVKKVTYMLRHIHFKFCHNISFIIRVIPRFAVCLYTRFVSPHHRNRHYWFAITCKLHWLVKVIDNYHLLMNYARAIWMCSKYISSSFSTIHQPIHINLYTTLPLIKHHNWRSIKTSIPSNDQIISSLPLNTVTVVGHEKKIIQQEM